MPIRISGSTGISGLDGSATTPVLQGASANSGIYYSGNTVFVATSGTTALTIGPTGNVAFANSSVSIGGQTISTYSGMMKNRIINGDFKIDQRFAGAANNNISGAGQYIVDRWLSDCSGAGKLRFQQNNTNGPGSSATQIATGFPNYFGCNVVSSNTINTTDYWQLTQHIEGLNIADLGWGTANASPVTLSFWSYSSVAGTHGGTIRNNNISRSYPFTYTINTANTWQYQTITIPGDTTGSWFSNNQLGMMLTFSLGIGSTYSTSSTNAWYAGNAHPAGIVGIVNSANGSLYFTGVQVEKGSQATPFEFRHYTTELQLCQRYFTAFGVINGNGESMTGQSYSSGNNYSSYKFPVTMRISPSIAINTATGTLAGGASTPTWSTFNNGSYVNPNQMEFWVNGTTTSGYAYTIRFTSGFVGMSAELVYQN